MAKKSINFGQWLQLEPTNPEEMLVNAFHWAKNQTEFRSYPPDTTAATRSLMSVLEDQDFPAFLEAWTARFKGKSTSAKQVWHPAMTALLRALDQYLGNYLTQYEVESQGAPIEAYDGTDYFLLRRAKNIYWDKSLRTRRHNLATHPIQLLQSIDIIEENLDSYQFAFHNLDRLHQASKARSTSMGTLALALAPESFEAHIEGQCKDPRMGVSSLLPSIHLDIQLCPHGDESPLDCTQAAFRCTCIQNQSDLTNQALEHLEEAGKHGCFILVFPELTLPDSEVKILQSHLQDLFADGGWDTVPSLVVAGSFHQELEPSQLRVPHDQSGAPNPTCWYNVSTVLSGDGQRLWQQHKIQQFSVDQKFDNTTKEPALWLQELTDADMDRDKVTVFIEGVDFKAPIHFVDGPMGRLHVAICAALFHGINNNIIAHAHATLVAVPSMSPGIKPHHDFATEHSTATGGALLCANAQLDPARAQCCTPAERSFISLPHKAPKATDQTWTNRRVLHEEGDPWETLLLYPKPELCNTSEKALSLGLDRESPHHKSKETGA